MKEKKEKRSKAVALQYKMKEKPAPQVIARGAGEIADKIVSVGSENKIPIVDDNDLLQLLYPLEPGEYIPESLYLPVAKLLAYISHFHQNNYFKKQKMQCTSNDHELKN
jgi:type III secretion system FlhB-like substrate exporter